MVLRSLSPSPVPVIDVSTRGRTGGHLPHATQGTRHDVLRCIGQTRLNLHDPRSVAFWCFSPAEMVNFDRSWVKSLILGDLAMERSTMFNGQININQLFLWPFSIAMLNYQGHQRVTLGENNGSNIFRNFFQQPEFG